MWFYPSINDEGAKATPVFMLDKAVYAVDVVRGVTACKGYPKEIIQGFRNEIAVVAKDDKRKAFQLSHLFGEASR